MEMDKEKLWNANYLRVWTSNFLLHFSFQLIVPLLPLYLSETFGAGKDAIGVALAGYAVMALLIRPLSGYIIDSLPRKAVLLAANFLFVACFAGYLAAGSLTLFAIFRSLHGLPFGACTVAINTVAVDSLPPSRRTEGMGYFGLSNNIATAIGPMLAIWLLTALRGRFDLLFAISMGVSVLGLVLDAGIELPHIQSTATRQHFTLGKLFLVKGIPEAVPAVLFAVCHAVVTTYVVIYGKQELGISSTGLFFTLFALGLIISRLVGGKALRENRVSHNASLGIAVSLAGYLLFALAHNEAGYFLSAFIIGIGNGHWYPAFLIMFINLAPDESRGTANSSILTAWDAGSGLGVLVGGILSEHLGYTPAFVAAALVFAAGAAFYYLYVRRHFEADKLR